MDKFFSEINKYVISILFFLGGGGFLAKYLSGDELESQPEGMLYASIALLLVGVLTLPVVLSAPSIIGNCPEVKIIFPVRTAGT